jgi:hypothetical protein
MKKNGRIITIAAFAFLLLGCSAGFVTFQPIQKSKQDLLIPAPELINPNYIERVKIVLTIYGEPYRTNQAGGLLVTAKLALNKELLWNYSDKALDDAFIEQARKK